MYYTWFCGGTIYHYNKSWYIKWEGIYSDIQDISWPTEERTSDSERIRTPVFLEFCETLKSTTTVNEVWFVKPSSLNQPTQTLCFFCEPDSLWTWLTLNMLTHARINLCSPNLAFTTLFTCFEPFQVPLLSSRTSIYWTHIPFIDSWLNFFDFSDCPGYKL